MENFHLGYGKKERKNLCNRFSLKDEDDRKIGIYFSFYLRGCTTLRVKSKLD